MEIKSVLKKVVTYHYVKTDILHPSEFRRNEATGEWEGYYVSGWRLVPFSLSEKLEDLFQEQITFFSKNDKKL